ncbi:MAG: 5-methyltetrahydropteroyltriglutamate--homocysteine S-methyltransferase [bacterium]|nr:5-methyltetrahydropteroyltriglutamate--homocysteine S-methyltransferase [bacterium]
MTYRAPFRFDIVGSFLRTEEIKQARASFEAGEIKQEELTRVEDREIDKLIAKQKAAGLAVITDGEFRRSYWHLDFMWGLTGIEKVELEHGYFFHGEETTRGSIKLTGKITGENHPFVEHFKYVKLFEDENTVARQTIPAPAQLFLELYRDENGKQTDAIYPDQEELIQDIAAAYKTVIKDLYKAGCRNVQLDDCTWGMFCDARYQEARKAENASVEEDMKKFLRLNNLAIEGKPDDLVITTHVCRGNYHSTWASSGGYATVAPFLFANENVDAYYLEFDDERSGDFEPLDYVSEDKKVVLGLITTKSPVLEDKETIKARIKEATKYIPLERLYLSPQCGFASCEIGNKLTEEEQFAKLALVKEIAEEVWSEL